MNLLTKLEKHTGIVIIPIRHSAWYDDDSKLGPRPWLHIAVRPPGTDWARLEIGVGKRRLIVTW